MTELPPFDPGLQPERTALAWRRTSLAVSAGSLVAIRLMPVVFGDVAWIIPGVMGVLFAGAVWITSARRLRKANLVLSANLDSHHLPGGRLLLALAAFTTLASLAGTAAIIATAL